MPRRGRRSAGADVAARADRLSDELLERERAAFAAVEAAYASRVPDVRRVLTAAARRGFAAALRAGRATGAAARVAESAREAADAAVSELLADAAEMALAAIGDELVACEQTLSERFTGVAEAGVADARARLVALRDEALQRWQVAAADVGRWWREDWDATLRVAALRGEDAETVDRRLFSPDPVRLAGQPGRGVWWRQVTLLSRAAREAEIALVNGVRLAAMAGTNAAAEAR